MFKKDLWPCWTDRSPCVVFQEPHSADAHVGRLVPLHDQTQLPAGVLRHQPPPDHCLPAQATTTDPAAHCRQNDQVRCEQFSHLYRNQSRYAPSQWETCTLKWRLLLAGHIPKLIPACINECLLTNWDWLKWLKFCKRHFQIHFL